MAKFQLLSRPLGTIERFVIASDQGAELEILAGHGAGLNAWRVPVADGTRELLYGYQSEKNLRDTYADTNAGVRLSPFAGRTNMAKWHWNKKTYLLENNDFHSISGKAILIADCTDTGAVMAGNVPQFFPGIGKIDAQSR